MSLGLSPSQTVKGTDPGYLGVGIFVLFRITVIHLLRLSAGQMMEALDRFHLREHTLVYLTSDQGGHLEEISATGLVQGGWNGIYKGVVSQYGIAHSIV